MQKRTVLIVDDSAFVSNRIKLLLEDIGFIDQIDIASNFAEALLKLENAVPDIVILDINLPDRSGIELIPHIKSYNGNTCIIMATNQSDQYYRDLCLKAGAGFFVDKSNEFDLIPQIISAAQ